MVFSSKETGTVYLVGAGPGHPGLITRWGYDLLQQCDAVAYDALIPMELITSLPERVEKHYVGKRAGKHSLPQPQINELLAKLAKRGLHVVRLKGGDPFVFGRIGEEAAYLTAAGIPVVMVPGVTAASAAAAMSGFSLTSRQESSWIFIATGHPAENSSTPIPWDRVAALHGGTLVIYMGIARLDRIVKQLLESGMAPETPAVVVHAASTGLQRSVQARLDEICSECRRLEIAPPALVIIGDSVHCHSHDLEAKNKPLAGKKVLLTGPSRKTKLFCSSLREAGAEPLPYPTTTCRRYDDTDGWESFLDAIGSGGICLFQTDVDVHLFFEELVRHGQDIRNLAQFKVIALGENTEAALLEYGIRADCILRTLEAASLTEPISNLLSAAGLPLILIHGNPAAGIAEKDIQALGTKTVHLTVEMESAAEWDSRWKDDLASAPPDFTVFTGTYEVRRLVELLGKDTASDLTRRSCVVVMDDSIEDMLHEFGLSYTLKLNSFKTEDLVGAMTDYLK